MTCRLFVTFQTHNSSSFSHNGPLLFPILPRAATPIIIQFNFLFSGGVERRTASHMAYVLPRAGRALLTAPLGICCPRPARICILMRVSCWDVNFRPSVIDGFHTSAKPPPSLFSFFFPPPLPADCWYISPVRGSFTQPLFFYGGIIMD